VITAAGPFPVLEEMSIMAVIEPSGWQRSRRPASADGPSNSARSGTCCTTCVSRLGGNCWQKIANIRVFAVATVNGTVLKTAFAKGTVVAQYDDPSVIPYRSCANQTV
jgi:hypothetical protein